MRGGTLRGRAGIGRELIFKKLSSEQDRLDGDARNARRDAGEDFPRDGACGIGVIEGRYGFVAGFAALRAENDHLVARLDARNLCNVKNNLIHADAAHERRAMAANQQAETVAKGAVSPSPYPADTRASRMGSVAMKVAL